MDYSPLEETIQPLWWLIAIIVVLGILRSAWFKGIFGEGLVRSAAHLRLRSNNYHPLHNVTLHTPDGTTQIDHIVVSRFGVFVVETKHMKGWIFGSENDAQWTQSIFGQSYRFQNPLRQNFKHVKAVEAALGIPIDLIHSVVVFSGASVFKSILPANVVRGSRHIGYIKSFRQEVFSDAEVSEMVDRLQANRLPQSFATRQQHIRHLRARGDPLAERRCSRCGNRMIIRIAKTGRNAGGKFWGCSSFPKCKAVQSVT